MKRLPFDPLKDEINIEKHGISLDEARHLDFKTAIVRKDTRFDYPEPRFQAIGQIGEDIYFLAFAMTHKPFRPISLRRAKPKEIKAWRAKQAGAKPKRR